MTSMTSTTAASSTNRKAEAGTIRHAKALQTETDFLEAEEEFISPYWSISMNKLRVTYNNAIRWLAENKPEGEFTSELLGRLSSAHNTLLEAGMTELGLGEEIHVRGQLMLYMGPEIVTHIARDENGHTSVEFPEAKSVSFANPELVEELRWLTNCTAWARSAYKNSRYNDEIPRREDGEECDYDCVRTLNVDDDCEIDHSMYVHRPWEDLLFAMRESGSTLEDVREKTELTKAIGRAYGIAKRTLGLVGYRFY